MAQPVRLRALPDRTTVVERQETIVVRHLPPRWDSRTIVLFHRELAREGRGYRPAECFISPHDFVGLGNLLIAMMHYPLDMVMAERGVISFDGVNYFDTPRWPAGVLGYVVPDRDGAVSIPLVARSPSPE